MVSVLVYEPKQNPFGFVMVSKRKDCGVVCGY